MSDDWTAEEGLEPEPDGVMRIDDQEPDDEPEPAYDEDAPDPDLGLGDRHA